MPKSYRKLRLEKLEDRCLMTAVAQQQGDTLFITGTDDPNLGTDQNETVIVRQALNNAQRFVVDGDVAGGFQRFNGVNRIEASLGNGVDMLIVRGIEGALTLTGGLGVNMGADADGVRLKKLDILGQVDIFRDFVGDEASDSPEVVTIRNCELGDANIYGGDGVDQVRIFGGSRVFGNLLIDTGFSEGEDEDGNDFVFLADSTFNGVTQVTMEGGDDDELQAFRNVFNGFADFDGGEGDSDLAIIPVVGPNRSLYFGGRRVVNFEDVVN